MTLFTLGINHNCADISQREQLAISANEAPAIVQNLMKDRAVEEAVVLSTCNRTEIYTVTQCHHAVTAWMRRLTKSKQAPLLNKMYEHHDVSMIEHLMSVASGVDSMIVGEPQILGQMKQSYRLALKEGGVGQQFQHLFPAVFEVAKKVRTQTDIGSHPVTMTYAVVQLAKQLFQKLDQCRVLLIGAGETIELMANYFSQHQIKQMLVANRTLDRAHNIARRYQGVPIRFEEIADVLPNVDLVISATSSDSPILDKATIEAAIKGFKRRPIFIADLAVPRDVAYDVAEIEDVHLYNIDHLQIVVKDNQKSRAEAAEQAREIIEVQASHYLRELRVLDAGDMIRTFRQKMESCRDLELEKAYKNLEKNKDPHLVIQELARSLTNKFMHEPTAKLRDAAYAEHEGLMSLLKELYEL